MKLRVFVVDSLMLRSRVSDTDAVTSDVMDGDLLGVAVAVGSSVDDRVQVGVDETDCVSSDVGEWVGLGEAVGVGDLEAVGLTDGVHDMERDGVRDSVMDRCGDGVAVAVGARLELFVSLRGNVHVGVSE